MAITVRAVYERGALYPSEPLALADGQAVELTVAPTTECETTEAASEDKTVRRIKACKSYREWLEVTKSLPSDDGGFDIVAALDENRKWSGERPLVPDKDSP